jgi:hypothetical protein
MLVPLLNCAARLLAEGETWQVAVYGAFAHATATRLQQHTYMNLRARNTGGGSGALARAQKQVSRSERKSEGKREGLQCVR